MKVNEIMSTPAVSVPAMTGVADAARQMDYAGVGCLVVIDRGRIAGVVTDRDLALRALGRGLPGDTEVAEVMTRDPVTVDVGTDVEDVVHLFRRYAFRRLPVLDEDLLVGMVSVDDLLLRASQAFADLLRPVSSEILDPQRPAPMPM